MTKRTGKTLSGSVRVGQWLGLACAQLWLIGVLWTDKPCPGEQGRNSMAAGGQGQCP